MAVNNANHTVVSSEGSPLNTSGIVKRGLLVLPSYVFRWHIIRIVIHDVPV